ncbi:MAG TPA: hypothetical protein VHE78_01370, partial [Gemmatimonadaceae bacterium]|nr:hypothetical protein [Gemmatimonadaceae bacterium]
FLYFGGGLKLGATGPTLAILYSIIPWIGVMAAGYAFGPIMLLDAARRRRICFALGGGAIAAFAILRGFDLYGDPRPWSRVTALPAQSGSARAPAGAAGSTASGGAAGRGGGGAPGAAAPAQVAPQARSQATRPPAFLRFLNTNKYPASLLFLLMTLGPMLFALPLLEGARGALASALAVFGRVPFFYYLLHIPLIHAAALVVSALREGSVNPWLFANHPMANPPPPEGYTWNLWLLYAVFVVVVAVLYVPCRWFARLKAARRDRWLSYL